jgi:hypothetical protein
MTQTKTEASEEKEPQSDPVVSYLIKSFQNLSETIQFIMIPVGYTRYDMQFAQAVTRRRPARWRE